MALFRFRLETVLRLREAERQQRRWDLAQAYEAERILQERAAAVSEELAAAVAKSRASAAPGEVNVDRLMELQRYALTLQAQGLTIRQQQTQLHEEVERRRLALVEADRQVTVLRKLRERQAEAFRLEQLKVEQKILDEIGMRMAHEDHAAKR